MAVSTCGGPIIPLRGGRVDTWTPGPGGTPEPQHDLQTLTESFRKQGFTSDEMIKLVACGHSFGGVRSSEFPSLVPPDPNSLTAVIHDFDTTPNFDNAVYVEIHFSSGLTYNFLIVLRSTSVDPPRILLLWVPIKHWSRTSASSRVTGTGLFRGTRRQTSYITLPHSFPSFTLALRTKIPMLANAPTF